MHRLGRVIRLKLRLLMAREKKKERNKKKLKICLKCEESRRNISSNNWRGAHSCCRVDQGRANSSIDIRTAAA
jgi:hypothetical protein